MWTWQYVNTTTRDQTGSLVAAAFFFDTITAYMVRTRLSICADTSTVLLGQTGRHHVD